MDFLRKYSLVLVFLPQAKTRVISDSVHGKRGGENATNGRKLKGYVLTSSTRSRRSRNGVDRINRLDFIRERNLEK